MEIDKKKYLSELYNIGLEISRASGGSGYNIGFAEEASLFIKNHISYIKNTSHKSYPNLAHGITSKPTGWITELWIAFGADEHAQTYDLLITREQGLSIEDVNGVIEFEELPMNTGNRGIEIFSEFFNDKFSELYGLTTQKM